MMPSSIPGTSLESKIQSTVSQLPYNMFFQLEREKLLREMVAGGITDIGKINFADLARHINTKWNDLHPGEQNGNINLAVSEQRGGGKGLQESTPLLPPQVSLKPGKKQEKPAKRAKKTKKSLQTKAKAAPKSSTADKKVENTSSTVAPTNSIVFLQALAQAINKNPLLMDAQPVPIKSAGKMKTGKPSISELARQLDNDSINFLTLLQ